MKDAVKEVKDAYRDLLDGAIQYNGTIIPVYEEGVYPTASNIFIIVSTVTSADISNKSTFFNEITVLIDAVAKIPYNITKTHEIVDIITGKALDLVLPSINTNGLPDTPDFQFKRVTVESSNHLPIQDTGTNLITRRVTRFSQILIEK